MKQLAKVPDLDLNLGFWTSTLPDNSLKVSLASIEIQAIYRNSCD